MELKVEFDFTIGEEFLGKEALVGNFGVTNEVLEPATYGKLKQIFESKKIGEALSRIPDNTTVKVSANPFRWESPPGTWVPLDNAPLEFTGTKADLIELQNSYKDLKFPNLAEVLVFYFELKIGTLVSGHEFKFKRF